MNFAFTNGTTTQKSRWAEVADRLLHIPSEALPLEIEVSFVDPVTLDSVGPEHTTLAQTTCSYDDPSSTCEVRDDATGFGGQVKSLRAEAASRGLEYNPDRFYTETAAHEVGHSAFAALPEASRVAIAQMFGAQGDDASELFPKGTKWQNRIGEGIAETFKEAFLPRRFRVFPNRTNHTIPYSQFPEFRALFRQGIADIPASGGFNHDVLELDSKDMRIAWPLSSLFQHEGSNSYYTVYRAGYDLFASEIPSAHSFSFNFTPPAFTVVNVPKGMSLGTIIFAWRYRIKVNGVTQHKFRGVWAGGRPANPELVEFYANWYLPASNEWDTGEGIAFPFGTWFAARKSFFLPNELEKEGEGWTNNYQTYEDAIPLGPLPVTLSDSISVNPGDVVSIHARALGLEWAVPGGPNFEEEAKERMGRLLPFSDILPLMHYSEPGAQGGSPIDVPQGIILPGDSRAGVVPSRHHIVGR